MLVSNIFYFHAYLGKISHLNHQPDQFSGAMLVSGSVTFFQRLVGTVVSVLSKEAAGVKAYSNGLYWKGESYVFFD